MNPSEMSFSSAANHPIVEFTVGIDPFLCLQPPAMASVQDFEERSLAQTFVWLRGVN